MIRRLLLLSLLCVSVVHSIRAQCGNRENSRLDWDIATWLDGATRTGYGFGTNAVVVEVKGSDYPGYPNQLLDFDEARGYSNGGAALAVASEEAGSIEITLTFESAVSNLRFSLYDIDLDDQVGITTSGSISIRSEARNPTFEISGSTLTGDGRNSNNDRRGTANIEISNTRQVTISIRRSEGLVYAGLSDFSACTDPPPGITHCRSSEQIKLDWASGSGGYPAGALQHSYNISNPNGGSLFAQVDFSGNTNHLTQTAVGTAAPDDTDRFSNTDGGLGDGSNTLSIRMDGPSSPTSSRITSRITFNQQISDARFSIYDIDNSTSANISSADRRDEVIVTGYSNGRQINPILEANASSPAWERNGNMVTAHPFGESDAEDGSPRNTLNVYFTSPIDQIQIEYREKGYTDPNKPSSYNPAVRVIAITPIFFCPPTAEGVIGDQLFVDLNQDGVYQAQSDIPLFNVEVNLLDAYGNRLSTTTDLDGSYRFDNLPAGKYEIQINQNTLPDGLAPTLDPDGGNDNRTIVTLPSNTSQNLEQDFAYIGNSILGDQVFVDLNADDVYTEQLDFPLPNIEVTLINSNGHTIATNTDKNGQYIFEGLPADTYLILVNEKDLPSGLLPTYDADGAGDHQSKIQLKAGSEVQNQDFGYQGESALGDQLYIDLNDNRAYDPGIDLPLAGIDITLENRDGYQVTTSTDSRGNYLFSYLPGDVYTISIDSRDLPSGLNNTVDPDGGRSNESTIRLGSRSENFDQDFGYQGQSGVGDLLFVDVDGDNKYDANKDFVLPGIDVILTDADGNQTITTTNAAGRYNFSYLPPGNYTIRIDQDDLSPGLSNSLDPDGGTSYEARITLGTSTQDMQQDFGFRGSATLGDLVYLDMNNDGDYDPEIDDPLSNIGIYVVNSMGDSTIIFTDQDGRYFLQNLPFDNYMVYIETSDLPGDAVNTIDPDGGTPHQSRVVLSLANNNAMGIDFGYYSAALPIGLISFETALHEHGVMLSWSSSFEELSDYYEVQRSSDLIDFQPIGTVKAAGNSTSVKHYSWKDLKPGNGFVYYRLKMVDLDGSFTYSQIKSEYIANQGSEAKWKLFPNPARDFTFLEGPLDAVSHISIINMNGKVIQEFRLDASTHRGVTLSVQALLPGRYQMIIQHEGNTMALPLLKI